MSDRDDQSQPNADRQWTRAELNQWYEPYRDKTPYRPRTWQWWANEVCIIAIVVAIIWYL